MSNSQNILVRSLLCLIAALAPAMAGAQNANGAQTGAQPPVAYASVSELNGIVEQLKQTAQSMQSDLQKTRIERWKADAATKRQTLANVESIQRNLQSALPETIAQLNNAPEDLEASFKLYRNLVVLYDYFGSVVNMAGALGSQDEFPSLDNELTRLESAPRPPA